MVVRSDSINLTLMRNVSFIITIPASFLIIIPSQKSKFPLRNSSGYAGSPKHRQAGPPVALSRPHVRINQISEKSGIMDKTFSICSSG